MSKKRVAVLVGTAGVQRVFEPATLAKLEETVDLVAHEKEKPPSADEAKILLAGADACITSWGSPRMTPELLDVAPDLKLIVHAAGSIKPIVTDSVYERGITVTSGAGAIAIGVAETTLGLIITSMKNVFALSTAIREGGWRAGAEARKNVKEMIGTTIGIVGAGHVGRQVIKLLQAIEVSILLYDPTLTADQAAALGATLVDLDTLMAESDVVSLHAPSIPATRHMINAQNLKLMKDGATLINTARGSLIDEQALVEELSTGRIWACLDVTDPEPPAADNPLQFMPNVVMTSHIAGSVSTGLVRIGRDALEEIERFVAGKPALNAVRQEQLAYLA